ncbi:excalibur calcium-binding domain-containing protein [Actinomycetospora endophytica]|uniref:Excalibur calcium-binding domain-containing protein n=1 Tax=Actinomycetospora endophytica TaxID=2291215 RepID=A0ABS8P9P5_9PSEU|nr:excalibur calcium-binding domain-containing protein [Actinomycetospora endophytica]MCD2194985.1 excalibur calcium-binding domain-containing protein [Actinomycetospora endophytica]
MKRTISATILAAAVLSAPIAAAGTASAATYYPNCKAAFAAGHRNIHVGQPGYRLPLDRNHNGVACESGDPAAANEGVGSGNQDVAPSHPVTGSGTSSTSGGSNTAIGATGSTGGEVALVPAGGAETGDGSTEGHTGWWVGGAFLAVVAGLVTARRVRVAGRR